MGVFFFYNNRKPRKYNYKPILYDPDEDARKERLQKRVESIKREMGELPERTEIDKKDFKSQFVSQTKHIKKRKDRVETGRNSLITNNWLLVVIAIILLFILFLWILY